MHYFENEERWGSPARCVNSSNQNYPLSTARLNLGLFKTPTRRFHYLDRPSNIYLEASLVEVVDIIVENVILGSNVAYKMKPVTNNSWVAAQNSLAIPLFSCARSDLRLPPHKLVGPVLFNLATATGSQKLVSHFTYAAKRGNKVSRIELPYILYNCLLFVPLKPR
jgi:hypothetical protein